MRGGQVGPVGDGARVARVGVGEGGSARRRGRGQEDVGSGGAGLKDLQHYRRTQQLPLQGHEQRSEHTQHVHGATS